MGPTGQEPWRTPPEAVQCVAELGKSMAGEAEARNCFMGPMGKEPWRTPPEAVGCLIRQQHSREGGRTQSLHGPYGPKAMAHSSRSSIWGCLIRQQHGRGGRRTQSLHGPYGPRTMAHSSRRSAVGCLIRQQHRREGGRTQSLHGPRPMAHSSRSSTSGLLTWAILFQGICGVWQNHCCQRKKALPPMRALRRGAAPWKRCSVLFCNPLVVHVQFVVLQSFGVVSPDMIMSGNEVLPELKFKLRGSLDAPTCMARCNQGSD
eukprot:jgi/Botrbrau1/22121/Bobra.0206s0045.1